jgi:hypothetical protein
MMWYSYIFDQIKLNNNVFKLITKYLVISSFYINFLISTIEFISNKLVIFRTSNYSDLHWFMFIDKTNNYSTFRLYK